MVCLNQLRVQKRISKFHKNRRKALEGCPQKRGICTKIRIMKPKKPNSAQRKVARMRLTTGQFITAAIPGQGHTLQQYSVVLIRGGRVRDLPGIQYKIIRGARDAIGVPNRGQRRSKFGTKSWKQNAKKLMY
jgi:small subunit ribosomal protein S12